MADDQKTKVRLEIAHVLFIDIVGYSKLSIDEQRRAIERLNEIVQQTEEFQKADGRLRLLVKSLRALHRYNVLKTPAVGVITVWKWPAAFLEGHTSGPCPSLFLAARVRNESSGDT